MSPEKESKRSCVLCGLEFNTAGTHCLECIEAAWNAEVKNIQNDTVAIHRKENIELNNLTAISGADAKAIDIEHENFVVLNLARNSDGSERANAIELITNHIKDLEIKIEKFRIQSGAARRVRAESQIKQTEKLTPEERERYASETKRANRLPSDKKLEKEKTQKLTAIEKQIQGLLKMPGFTEDNPLVKQLRALQK